MSRYSQAKRCHGQYQATVSPDGPLRCLDAPVAAVRESPVEVWGYDTVWERQQGTKNGIDELHARARVIHMKVCAGSRGVFKSSAVKELRTTLDDVRQVTKEAYAIYETSTSFKCRGTEWTLQRNQLPSG